MFGNVRILRVLFYVREEKEEMLVFTPKDPRECIFTAIPRTSVCSWPSLWKILLVKESCMPVSSSFTCHGAAAFQSC